MADLDGRPIPGATVETWQANAEGHYENQQPDLQPEFNLRGVFVADADGGFHYRTIRPAGYAVPDDGPVGQLLHSIGYPLRRPAHLQFMISAPGFETLTTHVYDRCDPQLAEDAIFGVARNCSAISASARTAKGSARGPSTSPSFLPAAGTGGGPHDAEVHLYGQPGADRVRRGRARSARRRLDRPARLPPRASCSRPRSRPRRRRRSPHRLGGRCGRRLRRRRHAHAGRGHRSRGRGGARRRRRLPRLARRRLDHRARQGDRLSHRPAADRRSRRPMPARR